jgi:hypothetical protein
MRDGRVVFVEIKTATPPEKMAEAAVMASRGKRGKR